jgi:nucleotide-binding universal stress UspA family protein
LPRVPGFRIIQHTGAVGTRLSPGSIVVAVDGSEHATRALEWAVEQAGLENRRLVALSAFASGTAWDSLVPGTGDVAIATEGPGQAAYALAEEAAAFARQLTPGVVVEGMGVPGDPRQVLVDLSPQAHLLVMGSRGRGPLRTMLLGSVSSAVVKQARCPVVVCRPRRSSGPGAGVVVGADGTPESLPVIEFAFQQASLRGLPLTVLHVYWDAVTAVAGLRRAPESLLGEPDIEDLRVVLSQSIAGLRERFSDVDVTLRLSHGLVDAVLVHDRSWDLVIVGRHPVDTVSRVLIGSIADAVLERAHTTVAMVPEASTS